MKPGDPTNQARMGSGESRLADLLARHTVVGTLWRAEGAFVRCEACAHRCRLSPGQYGICKVRFNDGGQLQVPFGYVAGAQCDPVEKKPFYHLYPGSDALTFGMLGCNFHCGFCQNWVTSQALHQATPAAAIRPVTPVQLVNAARQAGARLVVSSYNEPLISAEWAAAVFKQAQAAGLGCAFVSNGYVTAETLELLRPYLVAYKIDLKSFDDRRYRTLGGTLQAVKEGIRLVHRQGVWLEVVTLLVAGFNDSETEVREMARFLVSVSRDIPWHVTASHPDYKMSGGRPTTAGQLVRAAEIGVEEGLRFVYAGNAPGRVGDWENTYCPSCRELVIERRGYQVQANRLGSNGACPKCHTRLSGRWAG